MPLVELSGIYKSYFEGTSREFFALKNVNLQIKKGEYIAVMGPSGSGKSTLLHLLGLLDKHSKGKYVLDDVDIEYLIDNELSDLRNKKIGFIFQSFNLFPQLDVVTNVEVPMEYGRHPFHVRKERAISLLKRVGLSHRIFHKPNELSGGEMQRVAIARALSNHPSLILADEPTGNLDVKTGNEILDLFDELHEAGSTIIVVTHNTDISKRTDRVIYLKDGEIQ